MLNHDPLITKKIYYIRKILKEYANDVKIYKQISKFNRPIIVKYMHDNKCEFYEAQSAIKGQLKEYPKDSNWCNYLYITYLHIIYLKIKGVNKQHTKDDKNYENNVYFKITMEKLEKEFSLSHQVGQEGLYVNTNS